MTPVAMSPPTAAEPIETRPCDACGTPVDPVRAPYVACIDDRFRYYCSKGCRERARPLAPRVTSARAERTSASPQPSLVEAAAMLGIPSEALGITDRDDRAARAEAPETSVVTEAPEPVADPRGATAAVSIAAIAWMTAALLDPGSAGVGALWMLSFAAVGFAARQGLRAHRRDPLRSALGIAAAVALWVDAALHPAQRTVALRDASVLAALVPCLAWVEATWRASARTLLDALKITLPARTTVVRPEGPTEIATLDVRLGDEVVVGYGCTIPVDGVVRGGESTVLLHPEAPDGRRRVAGDAVLAGQRVLEGEVRIGATRAGDEVAWARLSRFLTSGTAHPAMVLTARRLSASLPALLGIAAVAVAFAREFAGAEHVLRAAAWLVGLSPCVALAAAVVETPFIRVLSRAARRGIVFRDAASIEAAARVGTVALCTRGTITRARLELTEIVSLGARSENELLALAAGAESVGGDDPLALALIAAARARGVRPEGTRRPMLVPGQGITALSAAGEGLVLGDRRLLLAEGIAAAPAEEVARAIEGAGRTTVLMAVAGRMEGVFGFEDPVRDEARSAVQAMIDAGFDVAVLGGASRGTIEAIGAMLDVSNLRPEVLPEERAAVVRAMSEVGNGVAVIGRPGRDGGALGAADVAISVEAAGGSGSETAVALASDDLRDAAEALSMARRATDRAVAMLAVGFGLVGAAAVGVAVVPEAAIVWVGALAGTLGLLRALELRGL